MTSVDIFNHLGWKGPFTPDYEYRVFLALQLGTDGTELTTLIQKGTRVNARSCIPSRSTVLAERKLVLDEPRPPAKRKIYCPSGDGRRSRL